jgi:hypothetical protein
MKKREQIAWLTEERDSLQQRLDLAEADAKDLQGRLTPAERVCKALAARKPYKAALDSWKKATAKVEAK